jgi:hypothetical protein
MDTVHIEKALSGSRRSFGGFFRRANLRTETAEEEGHQKGAKADEAHDGIFCDCHKLFRFYPNGLFVAVGLLRYWSRAEKPRPQAQECAGPRVLRAMHRRSCQVDTRIDSVWHT